MVRINRVILGGNLTRDPQLSKTATGKDVTNFGMAINNEFTNDDGIKQKDVCFVDCEIWGKDAVNVNKYFKKGRSILIEGKLKFEQWVDKGDGSSRNKLRVSVNKFHFVDSSKENNSPAVVENFAEEEESGNLAVENADKI